MTPGILPYKFLADYQNYPSGEIAGLKIDVGDRLAESTVRSNYANGEPFVTKVCRRATPEDLAAYRKKMAPKPRAKPDLVPIKFTKPVGVYRAGDIAGFAPHVAKQYVEGYVDGRSKKKVGACAVWYVDKIDVALEPPPADKPKPRKPRRRKPRRKRASLDETGAPEKK